MKTIQQWFETIPDPAVRAKALANMQYSVAHCMEKSLGDAIDGGFHWLQTPEGHDYWHDFRRSLETLSPAGEAMTTPNPSPAPCSLQKPETAGGTNL